MNLPKFFKDSIFALPIELNYFKCIAYFPNELVCHIATLAQLNVMAKRLANGFMDAYLNAQTHAETTYKYTDFWHSSNHHTPVPK